MRRRDLIAASLAAAALPLFERTGSAVDAAAGSAADAAAGSPFDYARLKSQARELAAHAHVAPSAQLPPPLAALDWDHYQAIRFRPERALWADQALPFRIEFFHLGLNFHRPVRMHVVEQGYARPIVYDPVLFDLSHAGIDASAL